MPIVCGVKFRGAGKVYYFDPGEYESLAQGDHVVVETARGRELAQVALPARAVDDAEVVGQLKQIVRVASTADLLDAEYYRKKEPEAVTQCREQVTKFSLPMKLVSAEYSYDGSRLTFFFTSEQRVDFRELVRELARIFRTRIELRQIGVRDESKIVGGMGKCGRPLCCATWLTEFYPVSIRMAKQQNLPLSPMEISGLCGRLLCCLGYENDWYAEVKARFPKVGKAVDTPNGRGKLIHVDVMDEIATVLLEDGTTVQLTAEQFTPGGAASSPPKAAPAQRDETDEEDDASESARDADSDARASTESPKEAAAQRPRGGRDGISTFKTPSADDDSTETRAGGQPDDGARDRQGQGKARESRRGRRPQGRTRGADGQAKGEQQVNNAEAAEADGSGGQKDPSAAPSRRRRSRRPRRPQNRPDSSTATPQQD